MIKIVGLALTTVIDSYEIFQIDSFFFNFKTNFIMLRTLFRVSQTKQ